MTTLLVFKLVFKIVLVLLLLFVIVSLARALLVMVKGDSDDASEADEANTAAKDGADIDAKRRQLKPTMSQLLGRRVMLCVILMVLILLAMATGFIIPNPRPY